GSLSVGGLAALYERCAVVVSNDTGPLHLAGAVGAAAVGIFWCGNLLNYGPVDRSRHRPLVSWRQRCPGCGRTMLEGCDDATPFVADITVPEVAAEALDLLSRPRSSALDGRASGRAGADRRP
ncbi:MAG: glycosyltransferase family 9 protein, partial [Acidimicrobiia bacterium]|nr:glycosyltransferase family 9 protein [Acidimicrobiia bacterium]